MPYQWSLHWPALEFKYFFAVIKCPSFLSTFAGLSFVIAAFPEYLHFYYHNHWHISDTFRSTNISSDNYKNNESIFQWVYRNDPKTLDR